MPCCCGAESYCCWDKDPAATLAPGESAAVSSCQSTPCAGMSNSFPDLMRYRSGPHASDAACAAACANVACNPNYPISPITQLSPDIKSRIYNLPRNFSVLNFSIAAGVNDLFLYYGIDIGAGSPSSPTRFLVWDYGDYDALGNVLRPRSLLGDTGWVGGSPPSCLGSWPYSLNRLEKRIPKTAIPTASCITVQVVSPCNVSDWQYQVFARII